MTRSGADKQGTTPTGYIPPARPTHTLNIDSSVRSCPGPARNATPSNRSAKDPIAQQIRIAAVAPLTSPARSSLAIVDRRAQGRPQAAGGVRGNGHRARAEVERPLDVTERFERVALPHAADVLPELGVGVRRGVVSSAAKGRSPQVSSASHRSISGWTWRAR